MQAPVQGNVTWQRTTFSEVESGGQQKGLTPDFARTRFRDFIRHFAKEGDYIYRDQLRQNYHVGRYHLNVEIEHIQNFDEDLAQWLISQPGTVIPFLELAAKEAAASLSVHKFAKDPKEKTGNGPVDSFSQASQNSQNDGIEDIDRVIRPTFLHLTDVHDINVTFAWGSKPLKIRELSSEHVSRLVNISGIVINASRTSSKCVHAHLQCSQCKVEKTVSVKPGFSGITIPTRCDTAPMEGAQPCRAGSFVIMADKCTFVDQQTMKLQESPETVPTGEMPRNLILSVDRYLVERTPPGTRVSIVGIFSTFQSAKGGSGRSKGGGASNTVSYPYIRVVGINISQHGSGRSDMRFESVEEEKFTRWSKDSEFVGRLVRSMDPAIYGHEDIKKALLCQLFGGSSKTMNDGIRRRGDINVLLLGDPSTAKSQLLKFVEKVAPIGVYTSGKGSSAAGLTACVIKEPGSGEFYLEGGSMVLADGGIVCIDEFDKMRDQDRVAIHEAMEQQTISIAKAGITTVLNSRTAVLAAANPVFGRYDDLKSAEEQIDFQSTILSRFDMIYIVKDLRDPARDDRIARHVLNIHMTKAVKKDDGKGDELDTEVMKRYIAYCRTKCSPRLSSEAADRLQHYYVNQRSEHRTDNNMPVIPITVRQLEALVRISESLAKMELSGVATDKHAQQAIDLFKGSTIEAINSGKVGKTLHMSTEVSKEIQQVEENIKARLPIGAMTNQENLITLLTKNGLDRFNVERAMFIMVQRNELEYRNQRRTIIRKR